MEESCYPINKRHRTANCNQPVTKLNKFERHFRIIFEIISDSDVIIGQCRQFVIEFWQQHARWQLSNCLLKIVEDHFQATIPAGEAFNLSKEVSRAIFFSVLYQSQLKRVEIERYKTFYVLSRVFKDESIMVLEIQSCGNAL